MFIKIHKGYRTVVACCDEEIIGKKFEEGILQIDARQAFYKGDKVSNEEAVKIMREQAWEDATFNIVGKKAVHAACEAGIATKHSAKYIVGIPVVLVF